MIFQIEKTLFQAIKTSSKSRKIDIFLNVLTHGFGPKRAIFPTFLYFQAMQPRKMSFMIFQNAKTLVQPIKTRGSKSRKSYIFATGLTMVQVRKRPFFQLFFLGNIGQENVFYDILQRKIAFLRYKNITFKKSKIDICPWFWWKNGHFSNFLGGRAIQARKSPLLIFQNEKSPCQAIKT